MLFALKAETTAKTVTIANSCWEVVHDAGHGGCIVSIIFFHNMNKNILASPIYSACQNDRWGEWTEEMFQDDWDKDATLALEYADANYVRVRTTAEFKNREAASCGITLESIYHYYPGHIRIERHYRCGATTPGINRFGVVYVEAIPELDRWMARRSPLTAFVNERAHTWLSDSFNPGNEPYGGFDSYEAPFFDWNIPWQLALFRRDAEAIELAIDSDYDNWLHAFSPAADAARYSFVKKGFSPDRHVMGMEPFMGMWSGNLRPQGNYDFNFYLNLPNNAKYGPDRRYLRTLPVLRFRPGRHWATKDEIREMAENGIQLVIHHHDSPDGRGIWPDGSFFWPDGVVDPYPPEEKARLLEVIGWVHQYGMKIIPYFNPFELHPLCEEFSRNENAWARMFHGKKLINKTNGGLFGIACCMCSRYGDFLKKYVQDVVTAYGFDGAYFDGLAANFCDHPGHRNGKVHCSMDEMIDLVRFARELVGKDGVVALHNTGCANIGLENYCDTDLTMEDVCGFANFTKEIPSNGNFGEVFRYGHHIARVACYYTALCKGMPDYQTELKKFITRAHLEGIAFYEVPYFSAPGCTGIATDDYFRVFRALARLGYDHLQFMSTLQHPPVTVTNSRIRAALYRTDTVALLILGNADSGKAESTNFTLLFPCRSMYTEEGETYDGRELMLPPFGYALIFCNLT